MKVFLSGSITSDKDYKKHFKEKSDLFKAQGMEVFDPSLLPPNLPYTTHKKLCLAEERTGKFPTISFSCDEWCIEYNEEYISVACF